MKTIREKSALSFTTVYCTRRVRVYAYLLFLKSINPPATCNSPPRRACRLSRDEMYYRHRRVLCGSRDVAVRSLNFNEITHFRGKLRGRVVLSNFVLVIRIRRHHGLSRFPQKLKRRHFILCSTSTRPNRRKFIGWSSVFRDLSLMCASDYRPNILWQSKPYYDLKSLNRVNFYTLQCFI